MAYAEGSERPDLVSPSPENTVVSIAKQERIEQELKEVLDLSSATMSGQLVVSGVAKLVDKEEQRGLGNIISSVLKAMEEAIFGKVKEYLSVEGDIIIEYPEASSAKVSITNDADEVTDISSSQRKSI